MEETTKRGEHSDAAGGQPFFADKKGDEEEKTTQSNVTARSWLENLSAEECAEAMSFQDGPFLASFLHIASSWSPLSDAGDGQAAAAAATLDGKSPLEYRVEHYQYQRDVALYVFLSGDLEFLKIVVGRRPLSYVTSTY
jgi:hypothetical protein